MATCDNGHAGLVTCPECHGTGTIPPNPAPGAATQECPTCHGAKLMEQTVTLTPHSCRG
jgi:DnaJ-class molecular chaperone